MDKIYVLTFENYRITGIIKGSHALLLRVIRIAATGLVRSEQTHKVIIDNIAEVSAGSTLITLLEPCGHSAVDSPF